MVLFAILMPLSYAKAEHHEFEEKETLVKIAFIFKILDYTKADWPENADMPLCFYGFSKEKFAFISSNLSQTPYKNIKLMRKEKGKSVDSCTIVYFDGSFADDYEAVVAKIKGKPILTIADIKYFADKGGIIEFYNYRDKIRFFINNEVALKQNIKFNAKLLELGGRRYD